MVTEPNEATRERERNDQNINQCRSIWKAKSWWFLGPVLFVLAFVSAGVANSPGPANNEEKIKRLPVLTVTKVKATEQTFERKILITGSLAAVEELAIGTETSGLALKDVLVDVGDKVKKGQLLARFNDASLKADLMQKEGALIEAKGNSQEAEANFQRSRELSGKGAVSTKDFDSNQATVTSMRSRVVVAEAAKESALVALSQVDVLAPAAGTISARKASVGAVWYLGAGELFKMIQDDRIEMVADVPEGDLVSVRAGQKANLKLENSDIDLQGTVRLVEPTVDPSTRLGRVRIEVGSHDVALPGMFVSGYLIVNRTQAITVPAQAVLYKEDKPFVFLLEGGNRVVSRSIEINGADENVVSVKSGIKAGDDIVIAGAGYLKDGDNVEVAVRDAGPVRPSASIER